MYGNKLKNLNVLSFNWHEPYLCLLAKTSHRFTIIEPEIKEGFIMRWRKELRSLPKNITLMDKEAALSQLESGAFDLAICQNAKDLVFIKGFLLPKILVFHNKLSTEIALGKNQVNREEYLSSLKNILGRVSLIFISESKQKDWGFEGTIITPGIDLEEYEDYYSGDVEKVLRVGNMIKERDLMMGYSIQEEILKDIPNTLMGENPTIPESRVSINWEELKFHYVSHRLFLNTNVNQYEDGYNLAMLEAMATGMPVVSTANDTSPIVNGENGFISDSISCLREKIQYLLANKEEAKHLGENGRRTVKEKFGLDNFIEKWETAITDTVKKFVLNRPTSAEIQTDKTIYEEGLFFWKQGEKEKAFQKYCDALNSNIENTQALTDLTKAAYDLGCFEAAEKYLNEYLAFHPANLNILFSLAGIQFKSGKIEQAKENLDKIFVFDSNHKNAIQLMKKIEGLK